MPIDGYAVRIRRRWKLECNLIATYNMGPQPRGVRARYPGGGNMIRENKLRHKNISVTVLDLIKDEPEGKTEYKDEDTRELKMIHNFQTRRKYTSVRKAIDVVRDKTLLELGLSGTKYQFGSCPGYHVDADGSVKSGETGKETRRNEADDSKIGMSPRLALPPISPRSAKSESTQFPANSLLNNEFGFRKQNTDTFTGLYYKRTLERSELEKELEVQSKRHIYACSNLGSIRNTSRAAQSVLRLKQTMTRGIVDGLSRNNVNSFNRTRSVVPKKTSVITHKMYPIKMHMSRSLLKPSVNPKEELPVISGSSLQNVVAGPDVT